MILQPNSDITISPNTQTLQKSADDSLTRTAVILEREAKDIAPAVSLGIPALALLTFYAKNDAFMPMATDKQATRFVKNLCNKTSDTIYSTAGNGVKASAFALWKSFEWTKIQAKMTFSELKDIVVPQIKRLGHALVDDAKSIFRRSV